MMIAYTVQKYNIHLKIVCCMCISLNYSSNFFYTDQNSRSPVKGESKHWFNQLAIRSLGVGKGLSENNIHDS